jgi:hypothetical protein
MVSLTLHRNIIQSVKLRIWEMPTRSCLTPLTEKTQATKRRLMISRPRGVSYSERKNLQTRLYKQELAPAVTWSCHMDLTFHQIRVSRVRRRDLTVFEVMTDYALWATIAKYHRPWLHPLPEVSCSWNLEAAHSHTRHRTVMSIYRGNASNYDEETEHSNESCLLQLKPESQIQ